MSTPSNAETSRLGFYVESPLATMLVAPRSDAEAYIVRHMMVAGAEVADPVVPQIVDDIRTMDNAVRRPSVGLSAALLQHLGRIEVTPATNTSAGGLLRLGWLTMRDQFDLAQPLNRQYIEILSSTERYFREQAGDEPSNLWPMLPHDLRNSDAELAHLKTRHHIRDALQGMTRRLPEFAPPPFGAKAERDSLSPDQRYRRSIIEQLGALRAYADRFADVPDGFDLLHDAYALARAYYAETPEQFRDELQQIHSETGTAQADWLQDMADLWALGIVAGETSFGVKSSAGSAAQARIIAGESAPGLVSFSREHSLDSFLGAPGQ
jgi:hypothetical protein